MPRKIPADRPQTPAQLREHYELERSLAEKLKQAGREQRRGLYSEVYDELFRRLPHHPQLNRKGDLLLQRHYLELWIGVLRRYLPSGGVFLEVGPGDCALALEMTKYARDVYAVDVSDEITRTSAPPSNFHLVLSDGCSVPVAEGSVDLVYSQQLMEHLHPDDAEEQLRNLYRALRAGGRYVCGTPNRLSGPHDVSRYFGDEAAGFHLKEYTVGELEALFRAVGFRRIELFMLVKGRMTPLPRGLVGSLERLLDRLPHAVRIAIVDQKLARAVLGINLIATK